ncbi:glutaminyl-tRNA synthetase [Fistulifera solaris]|uniref:glutamine--tRNA ligase n=1 Tax=Fistulifera solaris TaxID=1519565 RepID=A0A1Z5JFE6_FISSO|nr:glutaminyl-tRNA synthetase [Fistulifera solaris]|eukprot:GAX12725.1 glutaminyl-tRNA synthetase [Fistulifera solaris]
MRLILWLMPSAVSAFAYAPNFITKIIQEDTQLDPFSETIIESSKIKTRFPPEPNGYLHLGHAKAVSFNFAVARMFGGACHMRLDDTNPSKEDREYVESILEDVKWIQGGLYDGDAPWDGKVRKTSDYFDLIYDCAIFLIQNGHAYVDSLSADEMREYRGTLTEPGKDSPFRSRSVEENLQLFQEMKAGKCAEGEHVLRAKIDMASPNINMRDPTLYRIKHESHQETGDKWCIYPMYDFSHPISDAVEEITHSLCTLEFEDHRPFYDWTIEKLLPSGLISATPRQIEFSRLNIKSTVLSKRKLIQLVEENHVNGWDDPRLPTLSGLRRRGVPPSALRLFCERVGISKADSNIDYSVLEDCAREVMDEACSRAFCVLHPLKVTITNWEGGLEEFTVDKHPKLAEMGTRVIPFGKSLFIERSDFFDLEGPEGKLSGGIPPKGFKRLLPNEMVRLRYAYVIQCNEIIRDAESQEPIELKCTYLPDTRAGNTPEGMSRVQGIIHWVEESTGVKCQINQYDRLFKVEEPGKDSGDFLKDINPDSLEILPGAIVEPSVLTDVVDILKKIDENKEIYHSTLAYQFERSGYFALDTSSTGPESLVLNRVATLRDTWGVKKDEPERNRGNTRNEKDATPVEDIRRVAFRAATIVSADPHPEAENLLVCKVNCGDPEPRTVVAALAGQVELTDLVGSKVVVVANLKPAKMRGIESEAMLLAASDSDSGKVELLQVPASVPDGELLSFEGKEPSLPDDMLKSKGAIKAWERAKAGLRSTSEREVAFFDGSKVYRMMSSAGSVSTASLAESVIQ